MPETFVDRSVDVKAIDSSVKNRFKWSWLEVRDSHGDFLSDYLRKIPEPGLSYCLICQKRLNYGSKGKSIITRHAETEVHKTKRDLVRQNQTLPAVIQTFSNLHGAGTNEVQVRPYGAAPNVPESCSVMPNKQIPVGIVEPLIFAVQKHEVLYNNRHENYRSRELTELAWRKVADELQRDVSSCKATWGTLRGSFNRILAGLKSLPSGSAAHYKPKWYLYKQMQFLLPHVSHGQQTGNLDLTGAPGCSKDNVDEEGSSATAPSEADSEGTQSVWEEMLPLKLEVVTQSDGMESQDTTASTPEEKLMGAETHGTSKTSRRKRKRSETENDPVQTALVDYISKCEAALQQKDTPVCDKDASDSDLHYFRGLLPFVKNLSETNKLLFMSKTTSLLFELMQSQEQQ